MNSKKLFWTLFFIFCFSVTFAQKPQSLVKWISLEEAEKQAKVNPKPIMIDIYTDWCGWCKKMMSTTFSDPQVAQYINQNFYPVSFNAEGRDTIVWQGKTYVNKEKAPRGTHELTYHFLPQRRSYPSVIFMTGDFRNTTLVPGYLDANKISPILVYYQENLVGKTDINQFMAYFDSTFTVSNKPVLQKEVKWYDMQEALSLNAKSPKKILVHLQSSSSISSRVMDSTTFRHPVIANYLNKNYYPVRFDVESKDTIEILNHKLVNPGKIHQLVTVGMNNQVSLPALLFFNENNELITPVPQYLTPKFMEQVIYFFSKDIYKEKTFLEFQKEFKGKVH